MNSTPTCHCGKPAVFFYINITHKPKHIVYKRRLMFRCEEHLIYTKKDCYPKQISRDEYLVLEIMMA